MGFAGGDRPVAATPSPAAGQDLFLAKGCAAYHLGPDANDTVIAGPSLARLTADEAYVRRAIVDPAAEPTAGFDRSGYGIDMPRLALSAAEVDALVDYLLAPRAGPSS